MDIDVLVHRQGKRGVAGVQGTLLLAFNLGVNLKSMSDGQLCTLYFVAWIFRIDITKLIEFACGIVLPMA